MLFIFNKQRFDVVPVLPFAPWLYQRRNVSRVVWQDHKHFRTIWKPPSHAHLVESHFIFVPHSLTVKEMTNSHYYGKKVTFYTWLTELRGVPAAAPSLSGKLMIRYHKTQDGHVKIKWPRREFSSAASHLRSAFILILHPLALILLYTCKNASSSTATIMKVFLIQHSLLLCRWRSYICIIAIWLSNVQTLNSTGQCFWTRPVMQTAGCPNPNKHEGCFWEEQHLHQLPVDFLLLSKNRVVWFLSSCQSKVLMKSLSWNKLQDQMVCLLKFPLS